MASKLCRCIQLWFMLFLCWFVLHSDPLTQESDSDGEHLSTEKVTHGFTEQEATPPLMSIHHTLAINPDILDQNTLVTRPSIAPATPWDDAQILATISEQHSKPASLIDHEPITMEQIPNTDTLSSSEDIKDSPSDHRGQDIIEDISSDYVDEDGIKGLIKSLDPVETLHEKVDGLFETVVEVGIPADEERVESVEHKEMENKIPVPLPEAEQLKIPINEEPSTSIPIPEQHMVEYQDGKIPDDQLMNEELTEAHTSFEGTQNDPTGTPEAPRSTQEDLEGKQDARVGTQEDLGGTQEDLKSTQEDLGGTQEDLEGTQEDLEGTQDGLGASQEDMPSFKEWSQKFLAQEEEKKVAQINEKGSQDPSSQQKKKIVDRKQNNYASLDCGANIPEKNPEAQNAHSILLENKDAYMLNPCSANIWFIVELCDHAHVTSLQLANFELFSSTIETFQVSFSTRYPTREWSQLQKFVAKPEKTIQTFTIDPIFAKYIKVEQLSHHGSEHYCPWSLLRVYGNSMVEEYEEHESSQDNTPSVDEDVNTSSNTTEDETTPQGILKSATDAVLNFVKQTAKKLVNAREQTSLTHNVTNITKYPDDNSTRTLPPKTIVQLIPREDYEASCHGDNNETPTTCLPGSGCGSTGYVPNSYQAFLEIVHNICSRNMKSVEDCFGNFSKNLVANATNGEANVSKSESMRRSGSAEVDDRVHIDSQTIPKQDGDASVVDSSSSGVFEKQPLKGDDTTSSESESESIASEKTSTTKSVHIDDSQSSSDNSIASTVLPSGTSKRIRSKSVEVRHSVESSVTECDFDCASPLTPLAQPPLAVNDEPDAEELPTLEPGTDSEKTIPETNSDSPQSTAVQENVDSSKASETISMISASLTSAMGHETIPLSSIVTESLLQASEKIPTEDASRDEVNGDTEVHESLPASNREYEQGVEGSRRGNEEHEGIPNPHVDVLKTLTDAETKEGTTEPEHGNGEPEGDDGVQLNVTIVNSAEEERELGESDSDDSDSTDNDIKAVEGQEGGSENIQVGSSLVEIDEDTEKGSAVPHESETQTKWTDGSLKNSGTNIITQDSSDGQCQMKDGTSTKTSDEGAASSIEPGPTVNVEAVQASVGGNGNGAHGKKESIFVTLSRKIKALEQNVTMTNLFLEELSQRYRKSMDEMQKKMEKKLSMLSKNSKLLTKVNLSQNTTILALEKRVKHLEEKLTEATSRLNVVNQEVIERHVLGMCLQFVFVLIMWFVLRRLVSKTASPAPRAENGHLNNGSVVCKENDYRQGNGAVEDVQQAKYCKLYEFNASKPPIPEAICDTKRRKRRKNRPNSVASELVLNDQSSEAQNIVSKTAGLLFHTPGSHDDIQLTRKVSGPLRSRSDDSLNGPDQDERKWNAKKSALSPKLKKVMQRGRKDADDRKTRSCGTEARIARPHDEPHTKLVHSKSSGECYENKLALSDIALSTSDPKRSLGNARCSLQSTKDPLKDQKSNWIWGLG